jgi:hypothetical protein
MVMVIEQLVFWPTVNLPAVAPPVNALLVQPEAVKVVPSRYRPIYRPIAFSAPAYFRESVITSDEAGGLSPVPRIPAGAPSSDSKADWCGCAGL